MPIYLSASDLTSKYGFSDGDLLTDWVSDQCGDGHTPLDLAWDTMDNNQQDAVLLTLIAEYLLPLLPGVDASPLHGWLNFQTCHNRFRLDADAIPPELCGVVVEVSDTEVATEILQAGRRALLAKWANVRSKLHAFAGSPWPIDHSADAAQYAAEGFNIFRAHARAWSANQRRALGYPMSELGALPRGRSARARRDALRSRLPHLREEY